MQYVKHSVNNIHPVFSDIEKVYKITSVKNHKSSGLIANTFNPAFFMVFNLFYKYADINYYPLYVPRKYTEITDVQVENTVIVCFSGGKDSLATALYYKNLGYRVILYHLKGINLTYKDEYRAVEKLAQLLELSVVFEEVKLTGKQEWVEHPLKNWIIANMAIQWGIRNHNGVHIAFGNFYTSSLENDPFDVCGGDCVELWNAYKEIINPVIPEFEFSTPLENFQSTIEILLEHADLLPYVQSCIGAYRYREYLHKNNQKKFNIKLPEHRCGSCWKCCLEYIIFCDNNEVYEYNREYYNHCLQVLQRTIHKETGICYTMNDTWNHYLYYDKGRSKYFNENIISS